MTIFIGPIKNYVSTTLNGTITDSANSITVNDTSNLQAPGYVVIDREDGNGTATPNKREVIYYTGISGSDLTGCSRGADNSTARSHDSGALVEPVFTVGMYNSLATAVSSSLDESAGGLHVSNATVTGVTHSARYVGTSIASIARTQVNWRDGFNMALSSIASIAKLNIGTHINASGASVTGFGGSGGLNAAFQVPGSLASQANVGGMLVVPTAYTASYIYAYVQTPASVASVAGYIVKQGGTDVGMFTILGGATFASSASLAVTSLSAADTLTLDIRSTASLATDLSVVLRGI